MNEIHPSTAPNAAHAHGRESRTQRRGGVGAHLPVLPRVAVVALVGNPNTGKTTLFNALTGYRRNVANYPGVTVELARGPLASPGPPVEIVDLPGTYSLLPRSPDEQIVGDFLAGRVDRPPDVVLFIADATNLRRNFYLLTQVLECGRPVVVALNMMDQARQRGIRIDHEELSRRLGVPVVPIIATQETTVGALVHVLRESIGRKPPTLDLPQVDDHCEPGEAVQKRYEWIGRLLDGVIERSEPLGRPWAERLDRVLTHRLSGPAILAVVLFVLFQSIFTWVAPVMDAIDAGFATLADATAAILPAGLLRSFISDGLIGGVGAVLVFLPQIMLLFAFIAVLEDCGYMARAAFLMDRIMRALGLSGRAFLPLLSSFACAVPAILGTRTISDRRERFATILVAPFMSCSARLPVYVLLIGAFVPATGLAGGWISLQGLVMAGMYLVGIVVAVPVTWLLRRFVFRGPPTGFLMELPPYRVPRLRAVWQRSWFAAKHFLMRAGTVILLVNVVVWAAGYFPHSPRIRQRVLAQAAQQGWDEARTQATLAGEYLRDSYLGRVGRLIEPAVRPLGWDWRIGMAVVASFPAREVVVATLGTIYNLGEDPDETSPSLREALRAARWPETGEPVFTLPVALSIMVFFALCMQCASTLAVMGRETGSWRYPIAAFVGMTSLAYAGAWLTVHVARGLL